MATRREEIGSADAPAFLPRRAFCIRSRLPFQSLSDSGNIRASAAGEARLWERSSVVGPVRARSRAEAESTREARRGCKPKPPALRLGRSLGSYCFRETVGWYSELTTPACSIALQLTIAPTGACIFLGSSEIPRSARKTPVVGLKISSARPG